MHWNKIPIYIIDFQGNSNSGITEYGIVVLQNGEFIEFHTKLFSKKKDFINESFYFYKMQKFGILAAHNSSFEKSLIRMHWPTYNMQTLNNGKFKTINYLNWIDTYLLYKNIYPNLKKHKLKNLITKFNLQQDLDLIAVKHCPIKRNTYHCALYDAIGSALLLKRLSQLEKFDKISIEWLIQKSRFNIQSENQISFNLN